MQNTEIKKKALLTMQKNNTIPCSKQQKYLHKILGGELNYLYEIYFFGYSLSRRNDIYRI